MMKTRAAVAVAAGQPLEIMEVNLDGPRAGEVLVEIKATGLCHTDEFTRSGDDPEGIFPAILGHEGAGVVIEVGEGVTTLEVGDHVIPLYTPGMPGMRILPEPQDQPLPEGTRDARRRASARWINPVFDARWHAHSPLHGLLDFCQSHGGARDRARQGAQGRAVRQDLLHRLRRDHRHRGGHQHRQGRDRLARRSSSDLAASAST